MKWYRRSKGISHLFIMLWSASCPVYCTPRERIPITYSIGVWLCRGTSLDILEKGNISWLYQELNPVSFSLSCNYYTDYTVPSLVITVLTTLSQIPHLWFPSVSRLWRWSYRVKMCCRCVGVHTKLRNVTISFVVSVTCNNSVCLRWIFMKFDIWGFLKNLSRKFKSI